MKQILTALLFIPIFSFAQTDSSKLYLSKGTVINIELQQDLSSGTNNSGDIIQFLVSEPVIVGNTVLVQKGAKVTGRVTQAEGRKGMGKAGKLDFSIDYLAMPNGKNVKLTSELKTSGKNKTGAAVAEAVLLTPLFLLKKGKNVKFEKGHKFAAFVDEDVAM
jgi:hypothetical protein